MKKNVEMMSGLRSKALAATHRLVIKVGSKLLVSTHAQHLDDGGVDIDYIQKLAESIAILKGRGIEVVLVSSGAVGAGMASLGLKRRPANLGKIQACASIGQVQLMHAYRRAFDSCQLAVGQVLLGAEDFRNRDRYKNIKATVNSLLELGTVPIINENDTVAVEEIKVGDNDKLSADVAQFLEAQMLIIFTDEKGLYDKNPKVHKDAIILPEIEEITQDVLDLAQGGKGSEISTGGMQTKLAALQQATAAGCSAILAHGKEVLPHELFEGVTAGTFFRGSGERVASRERWLGLVSKPAGWVEIDAGAQKALKEDGSSLLLMGVVGLHGHFRSGELLEVRNSHGKVIARGASNHDSGALRKLLSLEDIDRKKLDKKARVVVHRNNLVVLS